MAAPLGVGWWKCCNCTREIKKAIHGDEKCPDCAHDKCKSCTDPYDGPTDWADVTTTQSSGFSAADNAAGPAPCDESLLAEDIAVIWGLELKEAGGALLPTGYLVKSDLPLN